MNIRRKRFAALVTLLAAFALVATACGDDDTAEELVPIKLQLQWVTKRSSPGTSLRSTKGSTKTRDST